MRLLNFFALLPNASASLLLAQDEPVQQVHAAQKAIGRAMRAKDNAALEKTWPPKMTVTSPGNKIEDRATVLALLKEGKIKCSAYSYPTPEFMHPRRATSRDLAPSALIYVNRGCHPVQPQWAFGTCHTQPTTLIDR